MATAWDNDDMIAAARAEAAQMIARVSAVAEDRSVTMKVAQFRKLAQLIDALADAAMRPDRFDAPIDGIRFWVPLPYLAHERARTERLLAAQSREIAGDRFAF